MSSFPDKIHRQHQKNEPDKVVPFQRLVFEQQQGECGKYKQGDDLLRHFELDEGERPAVFFVTNAVGRHHQAIFHKSDQPTDEDEAEQAGFLEKLQMLKLEVSVPGKRHKNIGEHQEQNGIKPFHGRTL